MKRKTPERLAKDGKKKAHFNFYLDIESVLYLKRRAEKSKVSLSKVINEAVVEYAKAIKGRRT